MALPPPDENGRGPWNDYRIDTPAFRLTALEKPDMSPYLVHMTGKEAIHGILSAGGEGGGKINAAVPAQTRAEWYEEPVVCFTESPLFAVDAFRYIRFPRWVQDMRYGVCFSKERLVQHGVRPALYFDSGLVAQMRALRDSIDTIQPSDQQEGVQRLLGDVIPLMNSLMEYEPKQGFIWEREWRYPDPAGFDFRYEDIEIICCPDEEQGAIAQQLGEHAAQISFVSSWDQYDDVTTFLQSRSEGWKRTINPAEENLPTLFREYKQELNKLEAYKAYALKLQSEIAEIESCTSDLNDRLNEMSEAMNAQEMGFCCVCGVPFGEEVGMILWNEDEGDYICSGCYGDFLHKCAREE